MIDLPVATPEIARSETGHERIRREELKLLAHWFRPGDRVLEIGGGSGFQAALLAQGGCEVISIDVAARPAPKAPWFREQYWPVQVYDGAHLPFGDAEFDVVFSSQMLLWVVATMPQFLAEIQRVLRPGGLTVHVVPSASWRWWTNLGFYVNLVRRVWRRLAPKRQTGGGQQAKISGAVPLGPRIKRLLFPSPVGPSTSTTAELISFRRARWTAAFRQAGYVPLESTGSGLFYTGFLFLPRLPVAARRWMAKLLGSSSHVIVAPRPPCAGDPSGEPVTGNRGAHTN
jgi:SAM-dependent methyltransferase